VPAARVGGNERWRPQKHASEAEEERGEEPPVTNAAHGSLQAVVEEVHDLRLEHLQGAVDDGGRLWELGNNSGPVISVKARMQPEISAKKRSDGHRKRIL
jgi:hypothetical protein